MADARFVSCSGCHAEISDDREQCPHCGTKVEPALETVAQKTDNESVKRLTDEVVRLERAYDQGVISLNNLTRENADLRAQNDELRRQVGLLPPKER